MRGREKKETPLLQSDGILFPSDIRRAKREKNESESMEKLGGKRCISRGDADAHAGARRREDEKERREGSKKKMEKNVRVGTRRDAGRGVAKTMVANFQT